jgi:dipeptidyl-peptidase-4
MSDAQFPADTFPRQQARTRRYTLGRPRTFTVADDGSRVVFLRSRAGDDPVGCLWVFDVTPATERVVFDPAGSGEEHLSAEERDRRERRRESLTGVTDYATDRAGSIAAFAMDGGLHVADLVNGGARRVTSADDPRSRPDPTGRRIAYVWARSARWV